MRAPRRRRRSVLPGLLTAGFFLALIPPAGRAADDFPTVTAEEKALTSVPGEPNAPAVVLFKKGEFLMAGYGRFIGSLASHMTVQARVKILTEAGKGNGEVAIAHSDELRLENFSGRTVLPDGRVFPVPADARFERRTSKSRKTFVTTIAFPAVQPGAILDYQYEVTFSSPFLLEPWYFSEEVPVRRAEVVYRTPKDWTYQIWTRSPLGVRIEREKQESSKGYEVRAWAENLPAVPDDLYGPPYSDLASQIMLLPAGYSNVRTKQVLMSDWFSSAFLVNRLYNQVRESNAGVTGAAREIAGPGSPQQKAEALYRFVRDEIRTEPGGGILVDPEQSGLRKILSNRRGTAIEKALLLQALLKEVGITGQLAWAADRGRGTIDPSLPDPNWFDTAFVVIGTRVVLDPADAGLAFGQVRPGYEGTTVRILETGKTFALSETPYDKNLRRAEIDLALDAQGRLAGTGTLRLTGLRAAEQLHGKEDPAKTAQTWTGWLAERWREYRISNVQVAEVPEQRAVTVTWTMAQREEEALGDEATVIPSSPLSLEAQPFDPPERKTDVLFDYPYRDEVELRLRWPEGWRLDRSPAPVSLEKPCGVLSLTREPGPDGRSLVVRRRLDVIRRQIAPADYESIRVLFGEAVRSDGQGVTLAKR
jgi:hypothetical protein